MVNYIFSCSSIYKLSKNIEKRLYNSNNQQKKKLLKNMIVMNFL